MREINIANKFTSHMQFLSEHGGSNNAHTTGESTNYFFDISPEFLSEALDMFVTLCLNFKD